PSAISSETSRNTMFLPKCLATERMDTSDARDWLLLVIAGSVVVAMAVVLDAAYISRARAPAPHKNLLLRGFYFVPDFVVLGTARNILPEIKPLLVIIHVVEVQVLHFFRRHVLRGPRIGWRVAGHVGDFF